MNGGTNPSSGSRVGAIRCRTSSARKRVDSRRVSASALRTPAVGIAMTFAGVGPSLPRASNTIAEITAASSAGCKPFHADRRHSATSRSLAVIRANSRRRR